MVSALSRGRGHSVQRAWVAENVSQRCYCQSGMIMAAAPVERNRSPTDADIGGAITNICRCGTYPRIHRAIRHAARVMAGEPIAAAPPPGIDPEDARAVPAIHAPAGKQEIMDLQARRRAMTAAAHFTSFGSSRAQSGSVRSFITKLVEATVLLALVRLTISRQH